MDNLFSTGIRPLVDGYLDKQSQKRRDYGLYWSASSAGYCMRKVMFDRLQIPHVSEDARKTRVFESGFIFHEWMQRITKEAGISVAQEVELQDEELMIRGHFDDLVLVEDELPDMKYGDDGKGGGSKYSVGGPDQHLILYDYKTQHSRAFMWAKKENKPMSHYHTMQLGTYLYMLKRLAKKELERRHGSA